MNHNNFLLSTIFVIFILFDKSFYVSAQQNCTWTDTNGYFYDLTPLINNVQDYLVYVPVTTGNPNPYSIAINLCRPTFVTACGKVGGSQVDACQQWPTPVNDHAQPLGTVQSTEWLSAEVDTSGKEGEGFTLSYSGFQSNLQLNFLCDPSKDSSDPVFVRKPSATSFLLQWTSRVGCATNGKALSGSDSSSSELSGGSIFMILVLVAAVVYLIGGIVFQKLVRHASGTDVIPNKEFWTELPLLVKDGAKFVGQKITGKGNYQAIPQ